MDLSSFISSDLVLLLVRIIVGGTMIYYGYPKVKDLQQNAKDFVGMGYKPGILWGTLMAFTEFFGGLAIVFGIYAAFGATLLGFTMIVGTFWKIKIKKPFTDWSYDLLIFALALVIMKSGAGGFHFVTFDYSFLRYDYALFALVAGAFLSHMPELLGEGYRNWGVKKGKKKK